MQAYGFAKPSPNDAECGQSWTINQTVILCALGGHQTGCKNRNARLRVWDRARRLKWQKDQEQRIKYYESVRDHTLALIGKADDALKHIKSFGDDFTDVFEKTHKRHNSLLNKVTNLIDREQKKFARVAKDQVKPAKKAKIPASKTKATASKPKPTVTHPAIAKAKSAGPAEGAQ